MRVRLPRQASSSTHAARRSTNLPTQSINQSSNQSIHHIRIAPFFLIGRQHVLRDYRKKVLFAYPFHKGDVKWDDSNSVRYPLLCSLAGLASGLMGIGGGMVKCVVVAFPVFSSGLASQSEPPPPYNLSLCCITDTTGRRFSSKWACSQPSRPRQWPP